MTTATTQTASVRPTLVIILIVAMWWHAPLPARAQAGGCPVFPVNNIWNMPVTDLPVDAHSSAYVSSIGAATHLHPDFGMGLYNGGPIGLPYTTVPAGQTRVPISFTVADQSDPGPYPTPPTAPIEGGASSTGDRHVLVVEQGSCTLYELDAAYPNGDGWNAYSGAVFPLTSNALRPAAWTSADAAGLPILPGLVRHDEVAAGVIAHALRFTALPTQHRFIWPARHQASADTDANVPPMGQRFRLKAGVNIASYSHDTQVILTALKTYGLFVADNGSNWFLSGAPDAGWNNDLLVAELGQIRGTDFEAVDESALQVGADSAEARPILRTVDPASTVIAGHTAATISGAGFVPGVQVAFGGVPATVQNVTATTIIVTVPPYPPGMVDVAATNPRGATAVLHGGFQYTVHRLVPIPGASPNATPVPHPAVMPAPGGVPNPAPVRH